MRSAIKFTACKCVSCGSVIRIVTDVLDMQRVSARLVPRLLSGTEKELDYQVRET